AGARQCGGGHGVAHASRALYRRLRTLLRFRDDGGRAGAGDSAASTAGTVVAGAITVVAALASHAPSSARRAVRPAGAIQHLRDAGMDPGDPDSNGARTGRSHP